MRDCRDFKYYRFSPDKDDKEFRYNHPDYLFEIQYINNELCKELNIATSDALKIARDGNYIIRYSYKHTDRDISSSYLNTWDIIAPGDYVVFTPLLPEVEGNPRADIALYTEKEFKFAFPEAVPSRDNIELCVKPCPIVNILDVADLPTTILKAINLSKGTKINSFRDAYINAQRYDYMSDARQLDIEFESHSLLGFSTNLSDLQGLLYEMHQLCVVCTSCSSYVGPKEWDIEPTGPWITSWHITYRFRAGPEPINTRS